MNLLLIALLGGCSGLRALTPIAVLCWFAYRGQLHFAGWRSTFAASLISVVIFTVLALAEIYNDKLPKTGSRLAPPSLVVRSLFGALSGLLLAQVLVLNVPAAIVSGIAGALIGSYVGWFVRTKLGEAFKSDLPVALLEDVVTIGLSITFLHLAAVHSVLFVGNDGTWVK